MHPYVHISNVSLNLIYSTDIFLEKVFFFLIFSDIEPSSPNHRGITENTAIIAGVVAALVLLVTLTLLAVYYINTHPTVAPPFYLMQVREKKIQQIIKNKIIVY